MIIVRCVSRQGGGQRWDAGDTTARVRLLWDCSYERRWSQIPSVWGERCLSLLMHLNAVVCVISNTETQDTTQDRLRTSDVCLSVCVCSVYQVTALWWNGNKQVAQLSQRDHTAGWVSYGQKWKAGTRRQHFTDIFQPLKGNWPQSNQILWKDAT